MIFLESDTIQAAEIAARAATQNAYISAAGTLLTALAAVVGAYVAFKNARAPIEEEREEKLRQKSALVSRLRVEVSETIQVVERTLALYRSDFRSPVEIRVLPLPESLEIDDQNYFTMLGPDITGPIALVRLRLANYRRAKEPIQKRNRQDGDEKPVVLNSRPEDIGELLLATEAYANSLKRLASALDLTK